MEILTFALFALLATWAFIEIIRWVDIVNSLRNNRLVYLQEYSGFLPTISKLADCQILRYLINPDVMNQPTCCDQASVEKSLEPFAPHSKPQQIAHTAHFLWNLMSPLVTQITTLPLTLANGILKDIRASAGLAKKSSDRIQLSSAIPQLKPMLAPLQKVAKTNSTHQVLPNDYYSGSTTRIPLFMSNLNNAIHMLWYPSIVDVFFYAWRRMFETSLIKNGFIRIVHEGVAFFVYIPASMQYKNQPKSPTNNKWRVKPSLLADQIPHGVFPIQVTKQSGPPIVCLHGITSIVPWINTLHKAVAGNRMIVLPRHPSLAYTMQTYYPRGDLMTTLQFARAIASFLTNIAQVQEIDVVAWSFGGFTRNYLNSVWPKGRYRKEVLMEPMGSTPYATALGASYGLLSYKMAYQRAKEVAPHGRWWHHLGLVSFLRYHIHTRPQFLDPYWSEEVFGKKETLNHNGVLFLLSDDDALVPESLTRQYIKTELPNTKLISRPGEHGAWPYNAGFVEQVCDWLKV